MQIFIKTFTGDTFTIEIECTDTVTSIKAKIEDKEGIPVNLQQLSYSGLPLEDERTASYYKIDKESTLCLEAALPGGRLRDTYLNYLANWYNLRKKICRKCYARLPQQATRCRQAKCGRTSNIRPKKLFYRTQLSDTSLEKYFRLKLSLSHDV